MLTWHVFFGVGGGKKTISEADMITMTLNAFFYTFNTMVCMEDNVWILTGGKRQEGGHM